MSPRRLLSSILSVLVISAGFVFASPAHCVMHQPTSTPALSSCCCPSTSAATACRTVCNTSKTRDAQLTSALAGSSQTTYRAIANTNPPFSDVFPPAHPHDRRVATAEEPPAPAKRYLLACTFRL